MTGKQRWYFWSGLLSPPPLPLNPPNGCCQSLLTFPERFPASEAPSKTQWHLEKEKKKDHLGGRRDGTGKMKSFGLWPHLIWTRPLEAADTAEARGKGHQTLDSSAKRPHERVKKREFSLLKIKRGQSGGCSAKECKRALGKATGKERSFLSYSEERVGPS